MKIDAMADSRKAEPEPVILYATRFARKCLLEHLCPPEHPVLIVEHQLVSEAKTRLCDHFLKNKYNRSEIESRIRKYAAKRVVYLTEDDAILEIVLSLIWSKSLDDIFPNVN